MRKNRFLSVITAFATAISILPTALFGGTVLAADTQTATEQETETITSVSSAELSETTESEAVQTTAVTTTQITTTTTSATTFALTTTEVSSVATGTYENLKYAQYEDHIEIIESAKSASEIVIPEEINGLPVTVLGKNAIFNNDNITGIIIPNTVTEIGYAAFYGCDKLESIIIPDSVKTMGSSCFSYCISLESVKLSNSMTEIGNNTFFYCTSLTDVLIPEGITTIGESAFCRCESLKEIILPQSVAEIKKYAFCNCESLENITIKNPDCNIYDDKTTIVNFYESGVGNGEIVSTYRLVIYGYENSTAEAYVKKYLNQSQFVELEQESDVTTAITTAVTTTNTTATTTTAVSLPQTSPTITSKITTSPCGNGDGIVTSATPKATTTTTSMTIITTTILFPVTMITSQTTQISLAGWYRTSVYVDIEAENVQIDKSGQTAEMTLTVCSQEGTVTPNLPDGIKLAKVVDTEGTEYAVNDDGTFDTNGIDVTLTLEIDESVQNGEYKLSFAFRGDEYVDTSTSTVLGGIHYIYICTESRGGVLTIGEPAVTTTAATTTTRTSGVIIITVTSMITTSPCGNGDGIVTSATPKATTTTTSVTTYLIITSMTTAISVPGYKIDLVELDITAENTTVDKSKGIAYVLLTCPTDVSGKFTVNAPEGFTLVQATDGNAIEYEIDENNTFEANTSMVYLKFEFDKTLSDGDYNINAEFYTTGHSSSNSYLYTIYTGVARGTITLQSDTVTTTTGETGSSVVISTRVSEITTSPCGNGDGIVTSATTKATETTTTVSISVIPVTSVTITVPMYQAQTRGYFTIDNLPDKLSYVIGEELDLNGLEMSIIYYPGGLTSDPNYHYTAVESVNPLDYPDLFIVDVSVFDNTKSGEYTITITPTAKCNQSYWTYLSEETFKVTVTEPEITTTAVTTTTATETTITTTTTTTSQPAVTGDADNDSELTVRDCAHIAIMIAEGKTDKLTETADFNGDGIVNVRDAAAIARKLAEKS